MKYGNNDSCTFCLMAVLINILLMGGVLLDDPRMSVWVTIALLTAAIIGPGILCMGDTLIALPTQVVFDIVCLTFFGTHNSIWEKIAISLAPILLSLVICLLFVLVRWLFALGKVTE